MARARRGSARKSKLCSVRRQSAIRNIASMPAEAIPVIGVGTIAVVTALELDDMCAIMGFVDDLTESMGLDDHDVSEVQTYCRDWRDQLEKTSQTLKTTEDRNAPSDGRPAKTPSAARFMRHAPLSWTSVKRWACQSRSLRHRKRPRGYRQAFTMKWSSRPPDISKSWRIMGMVENGFQRWCVNIINTTYNRRLLHSGCAEC